MRDLTAPVFTECGRLDSGTLVLVIPWPGPKRECHSSTQTHANPHALPHAAGRLRPDKCSACGCPRNSSFPVSVAGQRARGRRSTSRPMNTESGPQQTNGTTTNEAKLDKAGGPHGRKTTPQMRGNTQLPDLQVVRLPWARESQGFARTHCTQTSDGYNGGGGVQPGPPCVTSRPVVAPLRGPGQAPVLPFVCCVGSLLSVGRCGRCSCWCRFRVCGAQSLVCRGCAGCGGLCRLRVSGAQ